MARRKRLARKRLAAKRAVAIAVHDTHARRDAGLADTLGESRIAMGNAESVTPDDITREGGGDDVKDLVLGRIVKGPLDVVPCRHHGVRAGAFQTADRRMKPDRLR